MFCLTQFCEAQTQQDFKHPKFYAGVSMGVGVLHLVEDDEPAEAAGRYALGFYGGYSPFKWLRGGLLLCGWLIEPYGDDNRPDKGVSISNIYGQVQLFPFEKVHTFINIAGGYTEYINHHVDGFHQNGQGMLLGIGYEKDITERIAITLTLNYGLGNFNDVSNFMNTVKNHHYDVFEILIGCRIKAGKMR